MRGSDAFHLEWSGELGNRAIPEVSWFEASQLRSIQAQRQGMKSNPLPQPRVCYLLLLIPCLMRYQCWSFYSILRLIYRRQSESQLRKVISSPVGEQIVSVMHGQVDEGMSMFWKCLNCLESCYPLAPLPSQRPIKSGFEFATNW